MAARRAGVPNLGAQLRDWWSLSLTPTISVIFPPFSPPSLMVSCLRTCWNTSRFFLSSSSPSFKVYRSARAMATTSPQQPPWTPSKSSASLPPLKIWNTLTRRKTMCLFPFLFLPQVQARLRVLNADLQNFGLCTL